MIKRISHTNTKNGDYNRIHYSFNEGEVSGFSVERYIYTGDVEKIHIHLTSGNTITIRHIFSYDDIKPFIANTSIDELGCYLGLTLKSIIIDRTNPDAAYLTVSVIFINGDNRSILNFDFNVDYGDSFIDGVYNEEEIIVEYS